MDIKEINHIRELFLARQFNTKFKEETQNEGLLKLLQKIKEEEEPSKLTKELIINSSRRMEDAPPMHDLDRVQKENKELVAKLEKVEKDRKFAVESRIELIKILDGLRKNVSCLEEKCVNLESQKKAYMEREITCKLKILEEKEKLEVEREKNQALEEKVLKADEKLEKLMERIASLEEQLKKAVEIEADKLVDGNTDEYENNTMFGSEDDTVYVDFDQVVGNF
ncbi:uncharacterized protein LOC141646398 [Silene latifolia]|uniref:uncharacterized protein LOC141646398 n=1 Tax=Silene latifolia TaxID=37657 RepID=UPI003D78A64E